MINTGKLASTSSSLIKKIKENESENSTSKISKTKDATIANKLLHDFADIKNENQSYKNRLININNKLTDYENELSKTQFVENKIRSLEDFTKNNENEKIAETIDNTTYNGEKVLKEYFHNTKVTLEELGKVIQKIYEKYDDMNEQFKKIEVASQNIISLYSFPMNINDSSISSLSIGDILKSTNINQKRVMDLIS